MEQVAKEGHCLIARLKAVRDKCLARGDVGLYHCPSCTDTAYVRGEIIVRNNHRYETVDPCPACDRGLAVSRGIRAAEAKRTAARGKRADFQGDDIPF